MPKAVKVAPSLRSVPNSSVSVGLRPDSRPRCSRRRARRAAGDGELVVQREIDAVHLRAVAQRGVE
jgi:hypothetical protein